MIRKQPTNASRTEGSLPRGEITGQSKRLVAKIEPDIIYQRVRQGYTALGAIIAKQNQIPFVHHISADYACENIAWRLTAISWGV
jgi:hypothetical protein